MRLIMAIRTDRGDGIRPFAGFVALLFRSQYVRLGWS